MEWSAIGQSLPGGMMGALLATGIWTAVFWTRITSLEKRTEQGDNKFDAIMEGISQLKVQIAKVEGKIEGRDEVAVKIAESLQPLIQMAKTQEILLGKSK